MTDNRISVPIHLRWGDLDAYNHVNNASMLKLLEEARVRAFWIPGAGERVVPTAVIDASHGAAQLTLIARQEIEYLAPVPYQREPIEVQMWFGKIGGSSAEVNYEVFSPVGVEPRILYARASTVIVQVDALTGRPVRLAAETRAAWTPFIGDSLPPLGRR